MNILIRTMLHSDVDSCASIVCTSIIGMKYGFNEESMREKLDSALDSRDILFIAEADSSVVGFVWADRHGAFSTAPYLRLIAVDENIRSGGVGSVLLKEFEKRTEDVGRDFCLLVSDFNTKAIGFYEHNGYRKAGMLTDFACNGISEIIMVKKLEGNSL